MATRIKFVFLYTVVVLFCTTTGFSLVDVGMKLCEPAVPFSFPPQTDILNTDTDFLTTGNPELAGKQHQSRRLPQPVKYGKTSYFSCSCERPRFCRQHQRPLIRYTGFSKVQMMRHARGFYCYTLRRLLI